MEEIKRLKKDQVRRLSDAERAKRAERCRSMALRNADKTVKLENAVVKARTDWNLADIKTLSEMMNLPIKKVKSILGNKSELKDYKKQKKQMIDLGGMNVLAKLIGTIDSSRLSPYQAGMMTSMLYDKFYPKKKGMEATNTINIGDNRSVKVYYPNFDKNNVKTAEIIEE